MMFEDDARFQSLIMLVTHWDLESNDVENRTTGISIQFSTSDRSSHLLSMVVGMTEREAAAATAAAFPLFPPPDWLPLKYLNSKLLRNTTGCPVEWRWISAKAAMRVKWSLRITLYESWHHSSSPRGETIGLVVKSLRWRKRRHW